MKKVKFATIGTSNITKEFLRAAMNCEEFELAGVCSREKAKAEEFGKPYGAGRFYGSMEELAADGEIEAVYIASPNSLHCAQALQMLRAGKHVLCEKSLASNAAEGKEMLKAARENHVVLLEAMRPLYDPGFLAIRDNLKKLGPVRRASFQFCQYSSRYDDFKKGVLSNIFNPHFSAGALMDIGVYCVEPMVWLFGKQKQVWGSSVILENGIDGAGTILAEYGSMVAELVYSKITASPLFSQIQGENGTLLISKISSPRKVSIVYNDGNQEEIPVEATENNMIYELGHFIKAIREDEEVKAFQDVSLISLELMDQIRRQAGIVFSAEEKAGADR